LRFLFLCLGGAFRFIVRELKNMRSYWSILSCRFVSNNYKKNLQKVNEFMFGAARDQTKQEAVALERY